MRARAAISCFFFNKRNYILYIWQDSHFWSLLAKTGATPFYLPPSVSSFPVQTPIKCLCDLRVAAQAGPLSEKPPLNTDFKGTISLINHLGVSE